VCGGGTSVLVVFVCIFIGGFYDVWDFLKGTEFPLCFELRFSTFFARESQNIDVVGLFPCHLPLIIKHISIWVSHLLITSRLRLETTFRNSSDELKYRPCASGC